MGHLVTLTYYMYFSYIFITVIMQSKIMFLLLNIIYLLNSINLFYFIICHLFIYLITCSII